MRDLRTEMMNQLIEARTREEQAIEKFADNLLSCNIKEVFGDIYIPPVISLKALCPEAYSDFPREDVYLEQYEKMCAIFAPINKRITEYNKEAYECLQQFKAMR